MYHHRQQLVLVWFVTTQKVAIEVSHITSLICEDRRLEANYLQDSVKWDLKLPGTQDVIRDFIIGQLHLCARAKFNLGLKSGIISVKPLDVVFFNSKKNPLPLEN